MRKFSGCNNRFFTPLPGADASGGQQADIGSLLSRVLSQQTDASSENAPDSSSEKPFEPQQTQAEPPAIDADYLKPPDYFSKPSAPSPEYPYGRGAAKYCEFIKRHNETVRNLTKNQK